MQDVVRVAKQSTSAGGGELCWPRLRAGRTLPSILLLVALQFGCAPSEPEPALGEAEVVVELASDRVAAGNRWTCWLSPEGGVSCAGAGSVVAGLPDLQGVRSLSGTWQHACALLDGGQVTCWGCGAEDADLCDAQGRTWTALAVSATRTCGVNTEGLVECLTEEPPVQLRARLSALQDFAVSSQLACVADTDEVSCVSRYGERFEWLPGRGASRIGVTDDGVCGFLEDDSEVACRGGWPPSVNFDGVESAGHFDVFGQGVCALVGGEVQCGACYHISDIGDPSACMFDGESAMPVGASSELAIGWSQLCQHDPEADRPTCIGCFNDLGLGECL